MNKLINDFIPYFRELSTKQLLKLDRISQIYNCKNGDIVFLQGEFCNKWVIVFSGSFLIREKEDDKIIKESILLEGDSFDFESTIKNSLTSNSLEAIGDCSLLVINLVGLKEVSRKSPIITSLIKLQLNENEAQIWEDNILKTNKVLKKSLYRVNSSILWSILKVFPISLVFIILIIITNNYLQAIRIPLFYSLLFGLPLISLLVYHLNSRFTYLELNRESITKKEFSLKKISLSNSSIPMDNLNGTKITFKNRFYRILKIGEISAESATETLLLNGVYDPQSVLKNIETFRFERVHVDKAIELSSFKNLFSQQNNLFCIESELEQDDKSFFSFRKSPIHLLVRALPPFIVFFSSTYLLFALFDNKFMFMFNIFTLFVTMWFYIDWKNDRYAFEGNKVIDIEKKPFLGKEKRFEVDISSIQSVKKEQKNFLHILFNYGDIEINSLGGKIVYPSINNPDNVIENLYLVKKYYQSKKENKEKLLRQEEFLNYTKYYQELTKS